MTLTPLLNRQDPDAENYAARCRRRLTEELGINPEGVEVVLRLCHQVVGLQARLRELEAEVSVYQTQHQVHLFRYQTVYSECAWYELPELGDTPD